MERKLTDSLEEYLRVVYLLETKNGKARITDIATELDCSKPSVNHAMKVLRELGYINFESYGDIIITEVGKVKAEEILKRYDIIKEFLIQVLEIDRTTATKDARKMKHAISQSTINKLEEYIKSVIEIDDLDCAYDSKSDKCKKCLKISAKNRIKSRKLL